ncbi:MAG: VacJ family lipoprotein [Pseudomonadales bacterium]|nr:VacJ family lipoprotein [Pseudomonadales bacterium]
MKNQFARLLLGLACTALIAPVIAGEREQVFADVPDPASVQRFFEPPASLDGSLLEVDDPLEAFNRRMYTFNAGFDHLVFLPVVHGYQWVMPDFAERGVRNFFSNLLEIRNFLNNALQLQGEDSVVTLGRFVINTTVGIGGLFDPATRIGMLVRKEDFGQTLGRWGVGAGPYLVLPLLGPSGLRDTAGLAIDFATQYAIDPLNVNDAGDKNGERITLNLLNAVDTRANIAFRYYQTGSPFEYVLVRYGYTRMREVEIER